MVQCNGNCGSCAVPDSVSVRKQLVSYASFQAPLGIPIATRLLVLSMG